MSGWLGDALAGAARGAAAGSIVPGIGTAIGAAGGLALSLAPELGRHLFGPNGEKTVAAVQQVMAVATGTADPQAQVAALETADPQVAADLRVQLAQIAADQDKAERQAAQAELDAKLADVTDARARDLAVRTAEGGRNPRADIMLLAVTLGLLACIIAAATGKLGDQAVFGLVAGIAGMLSGCFKDAFGFEFGSSRQSEAKTKIIADLTKERIEQDGRAPDAGK